MSENVRTKIFFLKSHPADLIAVENYLTKRDYEVMSEYDLREALAKLMQFNPDFIFIAWDHPHERVHTIPRFISQSIPAKVVPYIQSTSKEQHRRLESSGFIHKIYPPVSGPGVIRTILKLEKEIAQKSLEQNKKEFEEAKSKETGFTHISGAARRNEKLQNFLNEMDTTTTAMVTTESQPVANKSNLHLQKGVRGELLKINQSKLQNLDLKKIDVPLKNSLKAEFQNTIKNKIVDIAQTYKENDEVTLNYSIPKSIKPTTHANQPTPAEEAASVPTEGAKKTLMEVTGNKEPFQKMLCLIVQSESWCGYLLVASQLPMNAQDYHAILQNWLQSQFVNMTEIADNDYFDITLENTEDINLKSWANEKADYLETINIEDHEVLICFFSINPKHLIIEANESYEMLEVPLKIISSDKKIGLSLFLHLPDNKKYILYTPAHQILSNQQKNKLMDKFIEKLFTPLDFEKELNKIKAEAFLNDSVKQIKRSLPNE